MARSFVYQSIFRAPFVPPAVAAPSFGTAEIDSDVVVNVNLVYQSHFPATFLPAPRPAVQFRGQPNIVADSLVRGGDFGFPAPPTAAAPPANLGFVHQPSLVLPRQMAAIQQAPGFVAPPTKPVAFPGRETFADVLPQTPRPAVPSAGFVTPPTPTTFAASATGEFPDLPPQLPRVTAPFVGFVSPPAATVTLGSFGSFPSIRRRSIVIGGNLSYGLKAPVTTQVISFTGGETFPDLVTKAPQAPETFRGFVVTPKATTFAATGEFPDLLPPSPRPVIPFVGFVTPPTPVTFFPTFGPQADVIFPRRVLDPRVEFTPIRIAYTPAPFAFAPSPYQFRQPVAVPGFTEFSALRIAYTPGPLAFSPPADLLRPPMPVQVSTSFVTPSTPAVATVAAFGSYPSIRRRGVVIGGNLSYGLAAPVTQVTFFFPGGETFPDIVAKTKQAPDANGGFVAPSRQATFATSGEFPDLLPQLPRPIQTSYGFTALQIAYTPGLLGFSQDPERFSQPIPGSILNAGAPGFVFIPTVAQTPSAQGFSQYPERFSHPRFPGLDTYSFVSTFRIAATPTALSFAPSPAQLAQPFAASLQVGFTFTAPFTTVATTITASFGSNPSVVREGRVIGGNIGGVAPPRQTFFAAASGEFPDLLPQRARPAVPFVGFVSPAIATVFGGLGEFPDLLPPLARPRLDFYSFVSRFQIAAATPAPLGFSQNPERFLVPTAGSLLNSPGFVFAPLTATASFGSNPSVVGFSFVLDADVSGVMSPPATTSTPSALAFLQSPDAFLPGRKPLELYSFVSASASAQATISFTQSSELFGRPRNPALDFYSFAFLQIAYTPSALTFTQSPHLFAQPRAPGLDRYDFSLLQIAYTPAAFGFAQHPVAFTLPTLAQLLASGTPGFVFIPTPVSTPAEFGFSQWPEQYAKPRMPGLDQYSFVSTFQIAATPSPLSFTPSPDPFFPKLNAFQISGFIVPPELLFPPLPPSGHGAHRKPQPRVRPIWDRQKEKEARRPDAPQPDQIAPFPPQIAPRPDAGDLIERQIIPPTPQPAAPTKRAKRQIEHLNLQEGPDYIVTVWYEIADVVHGEIALLVSAQAHAVEGDDTHLPAIAEASDQVTQAYATVKIGGYLESTSPDQLVALGEHLGVNDDDEALALLLDDDEEE